MKTVRWSVALAGLLLAGLACLGTAGRADEGLWLFNDPPVKLLEKRYGFTPPPRWLEHLQRSSVRFNNGGSGSLVSPDGLVMTNHHVGSDSLQKLSTKDKDYLASGFHARTRAEEIKCLDLELNVLMGIEDVSGRLDKAVKPGATPAQAHDARLALINTIEKESLEKTGLRSDVVTLYQGAAYHLYRYKVYTDVRLVFAPERDIAAFGGDPDNFEYPRYGLDVCFLRVYEDGKPARIEHYLKWSKDGARDGDLVFVSGHPGRTERQDTVDHLEFLRDVEYPLRLNVLRRREVMLRTWMERSPENARKGQDDLDSYQNSRKARLGMLAGLQDPALMQRKRAEERTFRERVQSDAWDKVAESIKAWRELFPSYYLLETGAAFNSDLFTTARDLVRATAEKGKPNTERLREYADAGLASLEQQLFSEAPVHDDLEILKLADALGMFIEMAGARDDLVLKVLAGKSPPQRAEELIAGTQLKDVGFRKKLYEGGQAAVEKSADPMIQLARLVDGPARKLRGEYESKVGEPQRQAYARLARARFVLQDGDGYPDAGFTLRLSFGRVKGYAESGQPVPWATDFAGLYRHADVHLHKEPYVLPQLWKDRKARLDLQVPFNFVCTADSIGGNSGSPIVNKEGEVVGLLFDGNRQSLVWDFVFTEEQARSVAVHSAGILEALRRVYDADGLVKEITGQR